MGLFKRMFTNWRILILILFLVLAIVAINPSLSKEGVAIRSISNGTAASFANPRFVVEPNLPPREREVIIAINSEQVLDLLDYGRITSTLRPYQNITVQTTKGVYAVMVRPTFKITILNETEEENVTREVFDNETNTTTNVTETVIVHKTLKEIVGVDDLGFSVYERPTSNLRMGLDLAGGTRVLLRPEEKATPEEIGLVVGNIKQRLNVYGLSDISVRPSKDLAGNNFITVEIAGVNREDIISLLKQQGKFEARIGNDTVFIGGKNDIPYVCLSGDCSGIDARRGCGQDSAGTWQCTFRFAITISPEAAKRQADATRDLEVVSQGAEAYLSKSLDLYLDDQLVDSLRVSSVFKGNALTDIEISGPGSGQSEQAAATNSLENMKRLQTILKTGSLPVKLEIVKTDSISPTLGKSFARNAIIVGLLAIAATTLVILVRYRKITIATPIVITMLSEGIIILGVASLIRWNLDLAAIAGIIIAIGTSVDSQIVIADEALHGSSDESSAWKDKMKRAFFVILGSYLTVVVAMIPLFYAGAGLLRGFALTTIIGVSIGMFITRPAYAAFVKVLQNK